MLNLSTLRVPGVYIDEVPKFPPSIAAVDTAVPAFIGYTQRTTFMGKDYALTPVRLESLVEFEEMFGGSPPLNVAAVDLSVNNTVKTATVESTYYLYDSLRMYFRNGGGKCYIVSLGKFPDPFVPADLATGVESALAELRKEDEPTLILYPDGIKLAPDKLGDLHKVTLEQCFNLKDRFLIADVKIANPSDEKYRKTDIDAFRTNIGTGNLQFGAAYYPYLRVNLPRQVRYRDVKGKVTKLGAIISWADPDFVAPTDTTTQENLTELDNIITSSQNLNSALTTFLGTKSSLEEMYQERKAAFYTAISELVGDYADITTVKDSYTAVWDFLYQIIDAFIDESLKDDPSALLVGSLHEELKSRLFPSGGTPPLYLRQLLGVEVLSTDPAIVGDPGIASINDQGGRAWDTDELDDAVTAGLAEPADPTGFTFTADASGNTDAAREDAVKNLREIIEKRGDSIFNGLYTLLSNLLRDAQTSEEAAEADILRRIPVLGNVISYLKEQTALLPPSGAIAGLYARVDAARGVWKAPANESLINVVGPSVKLEESQNGELNVDVNFGKSINVIKAFTGKGTLVWGARTLAGNSNEWRYVSVRRFFNMVTESSKKATEQFVFEPNDASTWVKVQAMIENFLTTLWRQGALQGAITEHAFYVAVGLGKTMTPLDILEGRMIVEIGLAVVRPAEFIILRFSHKMPES
ncbi:phage tail sheath C-terminal domain-containing protein [Rufibacter psychrotolerans]|uniref:phage tail sheath C-terminal domain-containing protein n=1 Tax=Rufibacter psychrotolerans TaxID=2812556 RepID=UPI001F076216|nr:phage tail sheath C-terminal domain-containing protein [Rufibacter sp. SYSU D00308]